MKPVSERYLMVYSGVLTMAVVIALACGFVRSPQKIALAELDVQRINLREPDGTLRLVISNAARAPGVFIKGQEFPQPDRKLQA